MKFNNIEEQAAFLNGYDQKYHQISAGTFQHELDHLDGLIYTDRMKDASSLTTIDEFSSYFEEEFKKQVISIVETYGS